MKLRRHQDSVIDFSRPALENKKILIAWFETTLTNIKHVIMCRDGLSMAEANVRIQAAVNDFNTALDAGKFDRARTIIKTHFGGDE